MSCVADQTDISTYKVAHVASECEGAGSCTFVGPDVERMLDIVEADGIPIIYIDVDNGPASATKATRAL